MGLPTGSKERKGIPIVTGVLDYFPDAIAEVAKVSKAGNDKHNPGEPLHWSREKSQDHADCIGRHLLQRGGIDPETGMLHSAELAWRAMALLQLELEANAKLNSYDVWNIKTGEIVRSGVAQPGEVVALDKNEDLRWVREAR